jgi:hypothetical protein
VDKQDGTAATSLLDGLQAVAVGVSRADLMRYLRVGMLVKCDAAAREHLNELMITNGMMPIQQGIGTSTRCGYADAVTVKVEIRTR